MNRLSTENKIIIAVVIVTIVILGIGVGIFSKPETVFTRDEMIPAGTAVKGNENAKAYLVEFSDFQCPACKSYKSVVDDIIDKNKDNLFFAYRHFPLSQHQFALKAALAAEAASDQGKFWEMYNYLFSNQENLSDKTFEDGANELKLDIEKFKKDMDNSENKDKVNKDLADGNKFGVEATPTFFLNGKKMRISGFEDLKNIVAKEISNNP